MNRTPKSLSQSLINNLINHSKEVRKDILRMIQHAGSGNPNSALSCVEILVWLLHHEMHIKINEPRWELRDRLILSKGHAAPVFYAICSQLGCLKKTELLGFRKLLSNKMISHKSTLYRDLLSYYGIRNPELLEELMHYLADKIKEYVSAY